jgi:hypothetical protein
MTDRLKNTLSFTGLAPGATAILPHGLIIASKPLAPDIVFVPSASLMVTTDTVNVTLFNSGSDTLTGAVLVEYWHTIEREFGAVQNTDLTVKPYVVVSVEGGNQPPQPPFTLATITIYARTTGDNTTGNGTLAAPYRTFQRAVQDVPSNIPAGVNYVVDITGITETLPAQYILPAWKGPIVEGITTDRFYPQSALVAIQATPQRVASMPAADSIVAASDIASVTQDPITQLITVNLNVARATWGGNGLKGKFGIGSTGGQENAVIYESDTTFCRIATTVALSTPWEIMEPGATLTGSSTATDRGALNAFNCDSIALNGIKVTTTSASPAAGAFIQGYGEIVTQLCELQSANLIASGPFINRIVRCWMYGDAGIWGRFVVMQGLCENLTSNLIQGPAVPQFRRAVYQNSVTLDIADRLVQLGGPLATTVSLFRMDNCLVRGVTGATGDGIRYHGSKALLNRVDVYNCARDGIRCELGTGILELTNCGSASAGALNVGFGLNTQDGMLVKADAATNTTNPGAGRGLRGTAGETKTGNIATQTWANFVAGGKNTYDITAVGAGGATGTGSRLTE